MSRFNAILLAVLALLAVPAFSADPPKGTTTAPQPTGIDVGDIDPATGFARTTVVKPLVDVAPVNAPAQRAPLAPRAHIALILPTASQLLGRLANAVRQGFSAAAEVAGKDGPPVNVTAIDNETTGLAEACRAAQAAGALLIVGGITRDGATTLAKSDCTRQPVLALNEPQATPAELPPNLYMASLSLENEARQVALMAVADGLHSAVVITSASPLAKRVQEAFEREWIRDAGQIAGHITFTGGPDDAPLIREKLAGVNADMVFMALDPPEARIVRPYVSAVLPLYATSMSVNPRAEAIVNLDLQGMRYMEMPWFVQPDHPAVMVYPVPKGMPIEEERLYAFGIDAYRIAVQLLRGDKAATLDGVTGKLTLEGPSQFSRTLTPAEFDGGRAIPLRTP
jgi:outer membrane PBP1 activator LpoA protein